MRDRKKPGSEHRKPTFAMSAQKLQPVSGLGLSAQAAQVSPVCLEQVFRAVWKREPETGGFQEKGCNS